MGWGFFPYLVFAGFGRPTATDHPPSTATLGMQVV
jgi:hypothetical protein